MTVMSNACGEYRRQGDQIGEFVTDWATFCFDNCLTFSPQEAVSKGMVCYLNFKISKVVC